MLPSLYAQFMRHGTKTWDWLYVTPSKVNSTDLVATNGAAPYSSAKELRPQTSL